MAPVPPPTRTPRATAPAGHPDPDAIPTFLRNAVSRVNGSERWAPLTKRHHQCLAYTSDIVRTARGRLQMGTPENAVNGANGKALLRGERITSLDEAARRGLLRPGMVIHVKAHPYEEETNGAHYVRSDDSHHWFIYMGKDAHGTPRFADDSYPGKNGTHYATARQMWDRVKGMDYGEPMVAAIYDPLASRR